MSSRKPVSTARPQTFWSIEYGRLLALVDRQALLLGVGDRLLPGPGVVADRRDHLQLRREVVDADLEADLVVALAGAAVARRSVAPWNLAAATRCRTISGRDSARHQRVAVHVEGVGAQGGQAEVLGELVLGVDHHRLHRAAVEGALADDVHVLTALADVDGHGHDLLPGLLGQPADADTGVETTGVGQHNPIAHVCRPSFSYVLIRCWVVGVRRSRGAAPVCRSGSCRGTCRRAPRRRRGCG